MMQGQKLWTLRWQSCFGHSPNDVIIMFCLERRDRFRLWVMVAAKDSGFSVMQCQKPLPLSWRSCLGGISDIVCRIFPYKGRQYYDYSMPLHSPVIMQDIRPEIVYSLLMLIAMMGQGACDLPFYLLGRPIFLLWIDATMQPGDCWMSMTIYRGCSVDAHLWAHLWDILTVIMCSIIVQKMQ